MFTIRNTSVIWIVLSVAGSSALLAGFGWRQAGRADLRFWVTDREPHGIGTYHGRPEFIWVDWSEDGPLRTIAFWNRCISSRRSLGHDGG